MNMNEINSSVYSAHNIGEVVRVATHTHVFIGHLIGHWRRTPGVRKVELYEIDRNGLEVFQGYVDEGLLARLAGPLCNAAWAHRLDPVR